MQVTNLLSAASREEFRAWLATHHQSEKECWVQVKRGRPVDNGTFWYIDAVEEALCFGWIDSTTKTIDGVQTQRFCPRRKGSNWTELNLARCRRMEHLGLMTDAGRAVYPDRFPGGYPEDNDVLAALQADPVVWANYLLLPDLYRRVRLDTIIFNKHRRPELYRARLQKFIDNTRQGILYGEWNDNGRLLYDDDASRVVSQAEPRRFPYQT